MISMTTQEAILYVMEYFNIPSYYYLAKDLSDKYVTVQQIQISKYLKGMKMSQAIADKFLLVFDIVINDVHSQKHNKRVPHGTERDTA